MSEKKPGLTVSGIKKRFKYIASWEMDKVIDKATINDETIGDLMQAIKEEAIIKSKMQELEKEAKLIRSRALRKVIK